MATEPPVLHGTAAETRRIGAPPDRVFAAFGDPALRARWFRLPGVATSPHRLDLRPGGTEEASSRFESLGAAPEHVHYVTRFLDVVADERIVYAYRGSIDGRPRVASLVTVELRAAGPGTDLTYTEQYALLAVDGDGSQDAAHLAGGQRLLLNGLQAVAEGR